MMNGGQRKMDPRTRKIGVREGRVRTNSLLASSSFASRFPASSTCVKIISFLVFQNKFQCSVQTNLSRTPTSFCLLLYHD